MTLEDASLYCYAAHNTPATCRRSLLPAQATTTESGELLDAITDVPSLSSAMYRELVTLGEYCKDPAFATVYVELYSLLEDMAAALPLTPDELVEAKWFVKVRMQANGVGQGGERAAGTKRASRVWSRGGGQPNDEQPSNQHREGEGGDTCRLPGTAIAHTASALDDGPSLSIHLQVLDHDGNSSGAKARFEETWQKQPDVTVVLQGYHGLLCNILSHSPPPTQQEFLVGACGCTPVLLQPAAMQPRSLVVWLLMID